MQGALYFPFIGVPESAWWTRTMLYWDSVATITPYTFIHQPKSHRPYTLSLVQHELLYQVDPEEVGYGEFKTRFRKYLHALSPQEIDRRRRCFLAGDFHRIHQDKMLIYRGGLEALHHLGLADGLDEGWREWVRVESTTAAEFMAALTLTLCATATHPGGWQRRDDSHHEVWVPTTDDSNAASALLAGLPDPSELEVTRDPDHKIHMRVRGELRASEVRTHLLEGLLPVPEDCLAAEDIVQFRKKYGNTLPAFRMFLERKIDEALSIEDDVLRFRMLDGLENEVADRAEQAERYLRESGVRKVSRSPILRLFQFVPLLKDPIEVGQGLLGGSLGETGFMSEPLAYLAFARTALISPQRHRIDPRTGIPLLEAMGGQDDAHQPGESLPASRVPGGTPGQVTSKRSFFRR